MVPQFKVGDKVNYTNDYGIEIGERTVVGITSWYGNDFRYFIEPTDSPWFPVNERSLRKKRT